MVSKKCKYAIKAILYIARNEAEERSIFASEIAEKELIPQKFLETILRELCNQRILISKRGRYGGYRLLRKPSEISFTEIMRMSCELKLDNVSRNNNFRAIHRKTNSINLLSRTINRFYLREELEVFKQIKIQYKG